MFDQYNPPTWNLMDIVSTTSSKSNWRPTASSSGDDAANDFSVSVTNAKNSKNRNRAKKEGTEISLKEFLDFLKTAYQVHDSLEGLLLAEGMTDAVDWLKLKESQMVKPCCIGVQTSETSIKITDLERKTIVHKSKSESCLQNHEPIKNKLTEVMSEGLLDSVLPYMVPTAPLQINRRQSIHKLSDKGSNLSASNPSNAANKKKSSETCITAKTSSTVAKTDSEVEIHVCDEVKGTKKTFICNQQLLVEKMGYFAEVTTGQRLEDMDISVHCDIGIFEWLMLWVKKDSMLEEDWPQLDPQCVVPVLVSAAFLQMEPLLQDCLLYCHQHMNEILRTTTNLSCLNDTILTRLAAMYTNAEVENIRDRKDKIQSRLFCKLIVSLCEPEPESVRGHWCSLARAFRCSKCQQLVTPSVAPYIPCVPSCMRLQPDGSVTSHHVRDVGWNINDYILKLQKSLKTWRKVYWRLWGDAHFLFCNICNKYFPTHQIGWCRHHPDPPQFFTLDAQKAPLPVGRYPCCGERAYRFQLLENYSGCQFREHVPYSKSVKDTAIITLLEMYRHLIEEEPPQLMFPERLTRLVARDPGSTDGKLSTKETFWWEGLEIVPQRPKLGLLGVFAEYASSQMPPEESTDEATEEEESFSWSSSASVCSEESSATATSVKKSPKRKKGRKKSIYLWQQNVSTRVNQDIQRAREETILKRINTLLSRRTSMATVENYSRLPQKGYSRHINPPGGVWVRLESEWRENNSFPPVPKSRNVYTGKLRAKPTNFFK